MERPCHTVQAMHPVINQRCTYSPGVPSLLSMMLSDGKEPAQFVTATDTLLLLGGDYEANFCLWSFGHLEQSMSNNVLSRKVWPQSDTFLFLCPPCRGNPCSHTWCSHWLSGGRSGAMVTQLARADVDLYDTRRAVGAKFTGAYARLECDLPPNCY